MGEQEQGEKGRAQTKTEGIMDGGENKMLRVEKHLYRVQHRTKTGEWSTRYYGIFRDWQRINRSFPLGDDLKRARNRLGERRRQNDGRYDFDAEKREREEAAKKKEQAKKRGVDFRTWGLRYFE